MNHQVASKTFRELLKFNQGNKKLVEQKEINNLKSYEIVLR